MENKDAQIQVFPWNQNFVTGIDIIDQQHRKLVDMLNVLALSLGNESSSVEIESLIGELYRYAEYHFQTEEAVWEEAFDHDVCYQAHKTAHGSFITELTAIHQASQVAGGSNTHEELLKFLIKWLANHILDDDMRMAKAALAITEGCSLEEAKAAANKAMSGTTQVFIDTLLMMYGDLSTRTLDLLRERHQRASAERALHEEKQREKAFSDHVVKSIPGLVYVYDSKHQLVRWNSFHENVLGFSAEELQGRPLEALVVDPEALSEPLEDLASGESVQFEQNVRYKDGREKAYLFTAVPFDIDGKSGFLGSGINISRLKAAERALEREAAETREALIGTVQAVSRAMEARDPYTAGHQQRVAKIAVAIAEKLELNEHQIEGIRLGASIHDIGKMAVPTELLVKPARLNPIEFELVKGHCVAGASILENVRFPWPILEMVSQHHERLDGSGYPAGLVGDQIGLEARILTVADVFEAMSSHRPYRPSLGIEAALEELNTNSGRQYDERVVQALTELLAEDAHRFDI
jgi:hemerythrin-like metal-binding protein/PAS domain S-box-containing protein/putative nucleotidyltransferase with HDIG domain